MSCLMSCLATLAGAPASRSLLPPRGRLPGRGTWRLTPSSDEERWFRCPDALIWSLFGIAVALWACLRRSERDVDQLGQAELLAGGEVRDRLEPGALAEVIGVQVGRRVATQQGGEHPGDDPASHRPELDGNVIQG